MDWKALINGIAPTVATALGGPLAGLAVEAIGKAIGMDDPTIDKVQDAFASGKLTGDQIVQLKLAEQNLIVRMEELSISREQLEYGDRDSARKRESAVKDNVNRNLAYLVIGSFMALVGATLLGYARVESALAGTLVGYLSAKAEQVLAYYFGSTRGSAEKTALLAKADAIKQ
jgi:hypothetical protein